MLVMHIESNDISYEHEIAQTVQEPWQIFRVEHNTLIQLNDLMAGRELLYNVIPGEGSKQRLQAGLKIQNGFQEESTMPGCYGGCLVLLYCYYCAAVLKSE